MNARGRLSVTGICAALAVFACAPAADAAIPGIPEQDGDTNGATTDIPCVDPGGADAGERHCSGFFFTFDDTKIDINVAFPPAPGSGPDGDFPIIGVFHGWGGSKLGFGAMQEWLDDGYAVFSMSARGWGNSCGATDPDRLNPECADGYNHLMDTRFEVRDAQEVFEALADRDATGATAANEGLIDPQRIGATGGSYGGGLSMALGALKDREMVNDSDPEGTLVPWISEGGKQMRIAAAQPDIPWTDLANSLLPNGHTLDYVEDSQYLARDRIGVMKQSFVAGLYGTGLATSNYAGPGTGPMGTADPDADLNGWYAQINAGEPYDMNPLSQDIADEVTTHHSSYYIDSSEAPAPLLISNGWTDDLFPADEALRFYNRTRSNHPTTPISLIFTDHGHQRGQNKGEDAEFRDAAQHAWMDHYVKGTGPAPFQGVRTLTQTCGGPSLGAGGAPFDDSSTDSPYSASSWATIAPGEIRHADAAAKVIPPGAPGAGNPDAATTYDPVAAGNNPCGTAPGADVPGTASYRFPAAPPGGFTLMGSPTVVADILSQGPHNQVAARLLDIDPMTGDAVLVARALYRPDINLGTTPTNQVFQLHPNGYQFAEGHIAKLELLSQDSPYGRPSNGQTQVTISNLEARLPVIQAPGSLGGLVMSPAAKVVPPGYGYELASDYVAPGTTPTPDGDTDRDGIPNSRDRCPTVIGLADNAGCPEATNSGKRKGKRKCKKRSKKKPGARKRKCKKKKKK